MINSPEEKDTCMATKKVSRPERVEFIAADDYRIVASRFTPETPLKANLVVAGATGVPQGFYANFARYACTRGFAVMTMDYRGIGQSKPSTLRGFQADFLDWAGLDLGAAVDALASEEVPLFLVGHSFGGHALGLLPNHHHIARAYVFAAGAGWHGWMPVMESMKVRLLWNLVLPVLALRGYAPMSLLGVGEDLPLGVYKQWRHWCRFPHYFFDDPKSSFFGETFSQVKTPIIAANSTDDLWAQPSSRDAFMKAYTNAPVKCIDLDPASQRRGIGHMGYFRRQSAPLWDEVLTWFEQGAAPCCGKQEQQPEGSVV